MRTNIRKTLPWVLLICAISCIAFSSLSLLYPHNTATSQISPIYVADFSNDDVLVGASHNIFVGEVIRQIGTVDIGAGPESQFEVKVLENIKGNLKGNITIDQIGGYKNGVLYTVENEDSKSGANSKYLLQSGSVYVFATRYNKEQNWYTLNSFPTASKLLSNNASISDADAKTLADSDQRVQQLKAAYPHEILLDADIKHNNTLNSYASIQATQVGGSAKKPSSIDATSDNRLPNSPAADTKPSL